eukprot:CAMPEP_0183765212 /NCGR_PEP_ID=MMETSP0739-20130205/10813_1 /TAXON_ID=385413 /ORGANISM="Thalassiosira miniscula, Strain CCMP1093" /LENGTH=245 /DNA_ID=CAMNT_0026003863 /DNA_START=119 /DNA_END=856 /DNA_ORIENTATION=+
MEQCVRAWDNYKDGGGILCLKDYWKQEKIKERFGIVYHSFYDYARRDRDKRTALYSQVGPTSLHKGHASTEDMSASMTSAAEDEEEEEDYDDDSNLDEVPQFMGRNDLYDFIVDEGRSLKQLITAARRDQSDPVLVEFELWHLCRECKRLDDWLQYYGYSHCFHRRALQDLMDQLANKMRRLKNKKKRRKRPFIPKKSVNYDPPHVIPGLNVWQTLAVEDQHMEYVMTGGGWNAGSWDGNYYGPW